MSTILKVDDINVYYGSIHAIKGVSFSVEEGEIVTLIGANGAGKSTTLNTISGLLHSRTGSVSFLGENIHKVPPHKMVEKGLALVPEGRRVFLQMTVQENLEMGAYTQPKGGIAADLEMVFELFPRLEERRKSRSQDRRKLRASLLHTFSHIFGMPQPRLPRRRAVRLPRMRRKGRGLQPYHRLLPPRS